MQACRTDDEDEDDDDDDASEQATMQNYGFFLS